MTPARVRLPLAPSAAVLFAAALLPSHPAHAEARPLRVAQTVTPLPDRPSGVSAILRVRRVFASGYAYLYLPLEVSRDEAGHAGPTDTQIYVYDNAQPVELIESIGADCVASTVRFYRVGNRLVIGTARGVAEPGRDTQADPKRQLIRFFEPRKGTDPGESATVYDRASESRTGQPACTAEEVDRLLDAAANRLHR